MAQVKIKFWIFVVIFTASLFVSGCHPADTRQRLKPNVEFKGDRMSSEYQDAASDLLYPWWRARRLKRMETEDTERIAAQESQQQSAKNSTLKTQDSNLKQQGGKHDEFALRQAR